MLTVAYSMPSKGSTRFTHVMGSGFYRLYLELFDWFGARDKPCVGGVLSVAYSLEPLSRLVFGLVLTRRWKKHTTPRIHLGSTPQQTLLVISTSSGPRKTIEETNHDTSHPCRPYTAVTATRDLIHVVRYVTPILHPH